MSDLILVHIDEKIFLQKFFKSISALFELNPFNTVGTYMSHGTNVSQLRKVEEIQCKVTKIYLKHIYDINFLELI